MARDGFQALGVTGEVGRVEVVPDGDPAEAQILDSVPQREQLRNGRALQARVDAEDRHGRTVTPRRYRRQRPEAGPAAVHRQGAGRGRPARPEESIGKRGNRGQGGAPDGWSAGRRACGRDRRDRARPLRGHDAVGHGRRGPSSRPRLGRPPGGRGGRAAQGRAGPRAPLRRGRPQAPRRRPGGAAPGGVGRRVDRGLPARRGRAARDRAGGLPGAQPPPGLRAHDGMGTGPLRPRPGTTSTTSRSPGRWSRSAAPASARTPRST